MESQQKQKGTRVRKRSTEVQIQELLNQGCLLDNEPTNDLTISRMKFIQARLKTLEAIQAREQKVQRVEELTAELSTANQTIEQLKANQQVTQPDPDSDLVAQKLAHIRGSITVSHDASEAVPEPELTPEEIQRAEERAAELKQQQDNLITSRKQQAELTHQEKLAAVKAEIAAVEESNAQKIAANPELAQSERYKPLTTDAMQGYRPQHLRRFP